jgi:hypothetical protein
MFRSIALLLLAILAVAMASDSAAAADARIFEMRTYTTFPGKLPALHKRFREHTNYIFVRNGMQLIGYWTPTESPQSENTLIYILAYPSMSAREASWKAFREDPDWKAAQAESEKDGKLVEKVEAVFMTPTDFSPIH